VAIAKQVIELALRFEEALHRSARPDKTSPVAVPLIAHSMQKAIFSPQAIINETDMANGKTMFLSLLLM